MPISAPTSQSTSNFVCLNIDRHLKTLAEYKDFTYIRYVDDITFSTHQPFTLDDIEDIEITIGNHQFSINHKKTHMAGSNRRQLVTGLIVNEKVNINRRLPKALRAFIHDCIRNGLGRTAQRHFRIS